MNHKGLGTAVAQTARLPSSKRVDSKRNVAQEQQIESSKVHEFKAAIKVYVRIRGDLSPGSGLKVSRSAASAHSEQCHTLTEDSAEAPLNVIEVSLSKVGRIDAESSNRNLVSQFKFERVFLPSDPQALVFQIVGLPLLQRLLHGVNCAIIAYGQSGTGKTYTMQGPSEATSAPESAATVAPIHQGLVPRVSEALFHMIPDPSAVNVHMEVIEIYMEEIRDLLSPLDAQQQPQSLKLREVRIGGRLSQTIETIVEGAARRQVKSVEDIIATAREANKRRATRCTALNKLSSRSHLIITLLLSTASVEGRESGDQSNVSSRSTATSMSSIAPTRLYLVDLAGSERVGKSKTGGTALDEGKKINLSLTSLGNVINALAENRNRPIPYRDSILTRLLQSAFGGNSLTHLICTISASELHRAETASTLQFGARSSTIKSHLVDRVPPNSDRNLSLQSTKLITSLASEIMILKEQVQNLVKSSSMYALQQVGLVKETVPEVSDTTIPPRPPLPPSAQVVVEPTSPQFPSQVVADANLPDSQVPFSPNEASGNSDADCLFLKQAVAINLHHSSPPIATERRPTSIDLIIPNSTQDAWISSSSPQSGRGCTAVYRSYTRGGPGCTAEVDDTLQINEYEGGMSPVQDDDMDEIMTDRLSTLGWVRQQQCPEGREEPVPPEREFDYYPFKGLNSCGDAVSRCRLCEVKSQLQEAALLSQSKTSAALFDEYKRLAKNYAATKVQQAELLREMDYKDHVICELNQSLDAIRHNYDVLFRQYEALCSGRRHQKSILTVGQHHRGRSEDVLVRRFQLP